VGESFHEYLFKKEQEEIKIFVAEFWRGRGYDARIDQITIAETDVKSEYGFTIEGVLKQK
jgi:hypothetical protein